MAAETPRGLPPRSLPNYNSPRKLKPLPDLSYLAKLFPPTIWADRLVQGRVLREWEMIKEQVQSTVLKTAFVYCKATKGVLFKFLLQDLPNVQDVQVRDYFLRINFKDFSESSEKKEEPTLKKSYSDEWKKELEDSPSKSIESSSSSSPPGEDIRRQASYPPQLPPRKVVVIQKLPLKNLSARNSLSEKTSNSLVFSSHSASSVDSYHILSQNLSQPKEPPARSCHTYPLPEDISEVVSLAVRFSPLDTTYYLDALKNVLKRISDRIDDGKTDLDLALYSIDTLFLAHFLDKLYTKPHLFLEKARLKSNYAIHLNIKTFLDKQIAISMIRDQKEELRKEWQEVYEEKKISSQKPSKTLCFNFLNSLLESSPTLPLESSSSPRDAFLSIPKALRRFHSPAEKPETAYARADLAKEKAHSSLKTLHSPRSRGEPFEGTLSLKAKSSPPEENKSICVPTPHTDYKAYFLAISYLSYKQQYEPIEEGRSGKIKRKRLWESVQKCLPTSPLYEEKKHRREIFRLAKLKSKIETTTYRPFRIILPGMIEPISIYQSLRSFFPQDNMVPVMSVWINGQPLEMATLTPEKEKPVSIYFKSFVQTIFKYQREISSDPATFVERLFGTPDGEVFSPKTPEEEIVIFILHAASASFAFHVHEEIKEMAKKLPEGYTLKPTSPQPELSCEIFLREDGDFAVIRTLSYTLLKEDKGELIIKWKVWRQKEKWGCSIDIPVIDLASSWPPKELEEVYKTFLS